MRLQEPNELSCARHSKWERRAIAKCFSPVGSACCFKIKLVLVSKQEQDGKIKFSEECCESCVKNKPQNVFSLPRCLACLHSLLACHPSLSASSTDVPVGGKAGVLMLRCSGEQQWELMGAGMHGLANKLISFSFLLTVLDLLFLVLCSHCPPRPYSP